jgi:hypothetical protein
VAAPALHRSGTPLAPHGTAPGHLQPQQQQHVHRIAHSVQMLNISHWLLTILHWHTCSSSSSIFCFLLVPQRQDPANPLPPLTC